VKIAIIGGGAAGMVTAYYLDKTCDVTVFEKQPILGGNIRTLNKNVQEKIDGIPGDVYIDNGVIEFDESNFPAFHALMSELGIDMESVSLTTGYFSVDGRHYLSPYRILHTEPSARGRLSEILRLLFCAFDFQLFMVRTAVHDVSYYKNKPVSEFLRDHVYYRWLKMLLMYAYSIPYPQIDRMPAALAIPLLRRSSLFTRWTRIRGGVYSYIERILERFGGTVRVSAEIDGIRRINNGVAITLSNGEVEQFDKIVFATPPDQVMKLLSDPTEDEARYFSKWRENVAHTVIHTDTSMYDRYNVSSYSAFDVFEKPGNEAGYNAFLNPLIDVDENSSVKYNLAYNMVDRIDPKLVLHTQEHRTPLYEVDAYAFRDEIVASNGSNNTYHAGAYLYDGLHEGAVRSALAVAERLKDGG